MGNIDKKSAFAPSSLSDFPLPVCFTPPIHPRATALATIDAPARNCRGSSFSGSITLWHKTCWKCTRVLLAYIYGTASQDGLPPKLPRDAPKPLELSKVAGRVNSPVLQQKGMIHKGLWILPLQDVDTVMAMGCLVCARKRDKRGLFGRSC
jgi:hypothetical protein